MTHSQQPWPLSRELAQGSAAYLIIVKLGCRFVNVPRTVVSRLPTSGRMGRQRRRQWENVEESRQTA